jgi:type VI secretion system secreted protein VgrG
LRTDAFGAVRAGGGLLLSTDKQGNAVGNQCDMTLATQTLQAALADAQSLADQAAQAKAEIADLKAQNAWLRNDVDKLQQAVMVLASAKGVAVATPEQVMVGAGKDVTLTSRQNVGVNAFQSIILAAEKAFSVFAHTLGAKIFAARGKVQIQAQSDALELSAQKDVTVISTTGKLIFEAAEAIEFRVGGTQVTYSHVGIKALTPGDIIEQAAAYSQRGPDEITAKTFMRYTHDIQALRKHGARFSG